LGITTLAMVDTNSDPSKVDFAIPANDDATKSIAIITDYLTAAIMEGLQERSETKEEETPEEFTERMRGLDIEEDEKEKGERRGRGTGAGRQGGGNRGGGNRTGGANRGGGSRTGAPKR